MVLRTFAVVLALILGAVSPVLAQRGKDSRGSRAKQGQSALAEPVSKRVDAILAGLGSPTGDPAAAQRDAYELFHWVIAYGDPERDGAAFRSAAIVVSITSHLARAPHVSVPSLATLMRQAPTFAARLAFISSADAKNHTPEMVCAFIHRLAESLGARAPKVMEDYADFAAAVCVVHDTPRPRGVNENRVMPADGIEIFNYFLRHEKELAFDLRGVPCALLIFVVDAAAPISELEWAFNQFKRSKNLEQLYGQIAYDYEHIISGRRKAVTEKGFTLQNIKQWGGVCVDQAYFTSEVAKALGVPATVVVGRDVTIGHAWLGIFKMPKNDPAWDFNTGRYESYQKVRGNVMFPVDGSWIPDGVLDVLADSFTQPADEREASYALALAGEHLEAIARNPGKAPYPPRPDLIEGFKPDAPARQASAAEALKILRAAVERSPSSLNAWWGVRNLAKLGSLTMDDRREWADAVERLCGKKYPDFSWMMLEPMISSVDDPKVQAPMWNDAIKLFPSRPDLASQVRFAEAACCLKRGDHVAALYAYGEVIKQYANDSPMAVAALAACRTILEKDNRNSEILPLYQRTFQSLKAPDFEVTGEFRRQSNWYTVGVAYAKVLAESGKVQESKSVLSQIGASK